MEEKQYQPHQQRVLDEKQALDEKIDKLSVFMQSNPRFSEIDKVDADLLQEQVQYMRQYSNVLERRIQRF